MLCFNKSTTSVHINASMELRILKTDGWVSEDNKLTAKAIQLIDEVELTFTIKQKKQRKTLLGPDALENIIRYREMFPKGLLPSGASARVNVKELEKKFTWFFNTFEHDWNTIFKATRDYIDLYEARGYLYMQNSSYFISREDKQKNITSSLATACDNILENASDETNLIESKFNVI
jgi:hypothetical protein